VRVLAVCPGSTESEIHDHAGTASWLRDASGMMTAEAVGAEALDALDRGVATWMPGAHNRAVAALTGALPRPLLTRITGALFKPKGPVTGT
jgi:short-subunit dehydrogenase